LKKLKEYFSPPAILAMTFGACAGTTGSMLYLHELHAAAGFGLATLFTVGLYRSYKVSSQLFLANQIMSHSMAKLIHDLHDMGIEVRHGPPDDDDEDEGHSVHLTRKGLH
jgi:hypothetical protein